MKPEDQVYTWRQGELSEFHEKLLRRIHRANKRDTGMHLNAEEVGQLAYHFSNEISRLITP